MFVGYLLETDTLTLTPTLPEDPRQILVLFSGTSTYMLMRLGRSWAAWARRLSENPLGPLLFIDRATYLPTYLPISLSICLYLSIKLRFMKLAKVWSFLSSMPPEALYRGPCKGHSI